MVKITRILLVVVLLFLAGCASQKKIWQDASKTNTIQAFEDYLQRYPKEVHNVQARKKLKALEENRDYRLALNANGMEAFRNFLKTYPMSKYKESIEHKIHRINDEKEFRQAEALGTILAYEAYLKEYPNGIYANEANKEIDRQKKEMLDKDWSLAQKLNTVEAYENFLRKNPDTEYTILASRMLERIGRSEELERLRKLILSLKEKGKVKSNWVFIFAVKETRERAYFIYKDAAGKYYKITGKGKTLFKNGLDVPLLKYAKPLEGVIFYTSYEELLGDDDHPVNKPMDHLFEALSLPKKSLLATLHPPHAQFLREYTEKEERKGIGMKHHFLMLLTTVEEMLDYLKSRDPDRMYIAVRALGVFGDKQAIGPLRTVLSHEIKKIRDGAKEALGLIEDVEYTRAEKEKTIAAYKDFLVLFPDGYNSDKVKDKIAEMVFQIAKKNNTLKAYNDFIKDYPDSRDIKEATVLLNKLKSQIAEKKAWEKAQKANRYQEYSDYLSNYRKGAHAKEARVAIKTVSALTGAEMDAIKSGRKSIEEGVLMERLLFTGASCLDDNANWTKLKLGRKVYDFLKQKPSRPLSEAMKRVVLMEVDRSHVLFVVVKLGVSGTEEALVELLLEYGDKQMAVDYLNCGSKKLGEGGETWARQNGYYIIHSQFGSYRVRWGTF